MPGLALEESLKALIQLTQMGEPRGAKVRPRLGLKRVPWVGNASSASGRAHAGTGGSTLSGDGCRARSERRFQVRSLHCALGNLPGPGAFPGDPDDAVDDFPCALSLSCRRSQLPLILGGSWLNMPWSTWSGQNVMGPVHPEHDVRDPPVAGDRGEVVVAGATPGMRPLGHGSELVGDGRRPDISVSPWRSATVALLAGPELKISCPADRSFLTCLTKAWD